MWLSCMYSKAEARFEATCNLSLSNAADFLPFRSVTIPAIPEILLLRPAHDFIRFSRVSYNRSKTMK